MKDKKEEVADAEDLVITLSWVNWTNRLFLLSWKPHFFEKLELKRNSFKKNCKVKLENWKFLFN